MAEAKEKEFHAIVVYRLDRISRNIGDFAKLIEKLNALIAKRVNWFPFFVVYPFWSKYVSVLVKEPVSRNLS